MTITGRLILLLLAGTTAATAQQPGATLALRIGAVDGPDALGMVEAIAVDSAGQIYVLEGDAHRVRVYSPSGAWRHTVGRRGAGPGEFRHPVGMAWAPDGNLWVIDPGNERASIFTPGGAHVGDRPLRSGFGLAPWPGRFDAGGALYHYAADAASGEFDYVMVRYDASMTPLDTVELPRPPEPAQFFETRTARWGTVRAAVPFTPRLIWRLGSNGDVWWAWTARYAIYRGTAARRPLIARDRTPVPVTDEARDAAVGALDRYRQRGGQIDLARIPRIRPALQGFFLDDADRVWSVLTTDGTDRVIECHDSDGTFLRRLTLPVALRTSPQPVIRGNLVYGVVLDDLGVPYLVVLRLDP